VKRQVDSLLPVTALRGCSWTGNHRSVWFIFGSESSSPRRFLGITYSFKVTRKRLKCLDYSFQAMTGNQFFKIFWRRAFGARGRLAPPAAAPRTSTQSCRESMPVPPQSISPRASMPGRGQMSSTGADDGRAYSHARHLILMRCTSSLCA